MVLFTYTDYLRCQKLLRNHANMVEENTTNYVLLHQKQNPYHKHDKLYRDLLNNKKEFYLFLQDFFHYLLPYDITKYNRNFILHDYSNNYSDIVYKLKKLPVYLLIEHQSYIDYSIPYRIYQYYHCILEDSIDAKHLKTKNHQIPLVTPIILYTGSKPWNFVTNFQEQQFDYAYNGNLDNGKLSLSYNFINIHDFSKEELLNMHSMIAYAMAIDKCNNVSELMDTIYLVYDICSNEQKKYLYRMVVYLLKPIIPKEIYLDLLKKFNRKEETYMEELIERMKKDMEYRRKKAEQEGLEQGLERGMQQGIQQGIQQGMQQGMTEGIIKTAKKMLIRNMSLEDIADITGLTIQEIKNLKTA